MAENSSHNGQLSLRFSCMGLAPQFLMMQHKSLLAIVYLSRTLLHVGMRGVGDHHMLCPQTIFGLWVPQYPRLAQRAGAQVVECARMIAVPDRVVV